MTTQPFIYSPHLDLHPIGILFPIFPGPGMFPERKKMAIGAVARAEVGMKAYFKNKKLFLIGLKTSDRI
jgi:hypothetical protein